MDRQYNDKWGAVNQTEMDRQYNDKWGAYITMTNRSSK